MQKYYRKILGTEIFALKERKAIAKVHDLIIDPASGRLLAFVTAKGGLLAKTQIVAAMDVSEWNNQIKIAKQKSVTDIEKLPACNKIWQAKIRLVGTPVITVEKKKLGICTDYAIDTATFFLAKIIAGPSLRAPMAKQRIISFELIQSITRSEIIVQSDLETSAAIFAKPA